MNESTAVKSAVRVLEVLELLSRASGDLGISEIARRLAIPKSSTHMLLATLVERSYVVATARGRFLLHPMLLGTQRHWVGGVHAALARAARPGMKRLMLATGETAFLAVRKDERSLQYVEKVIAPNEVRIDGELGARRELHAMSAGYVFLAWQPEERTAEFFRKHRLARFTRDTVTDPSRLSDLLAAVKRRGYSLIWDTYSLGAAGLAAPVFANGGEVVASLVIAAPTARLAGLERAVTPLLREAEMLGEAIGRQARDVHVEEGSAARVAPKPRPAAGMRAQ